MKTRLADSFISLDFMSPRFKFQGDGRIDQSQLDRKLDVTNETWLSSQGPNFTASDAAVRGSERGS